MTERSSATARTRLAAKDGRLIPTSGSDRARIAVRTSVAWGDCDPAGVVFYPTILAWMDRAAHALFREIGIPREAELPPSPMAFTVVEVGAKFHSPALVDDPIEIRVWVTDVGRTSFGLGYDVHNLHGGSVVATGWERRVRVELVSLGHFVPVSLDRDQRAGLRRYLDGGLVEALGTTESGPAAAQS